jgi:hypothetical protein
METNGFQPADKLCLEVRLWKIVGLSDQWANTKTNQEETASVATLDEAEINFR